MTSKNGSCDNARKREQLSLCRIKVLIRPFSAALRSESG
jgi:hypothetical protein